MENNQSQTGLSDEVLIAIVNNAKEIILALIEKLNPRVEN